MTTPCVCPTCVPEDELSIQCPDCGINWWLFPPATVHGSELRRCIECKRIYNSDGVNVSHAES